jgi:mono/diheme cytochrome c family protein
MAKNSRNFNDPEWQKGTSVEEIAKLTLEGRGKMPKFEGKLKQEEIEAIAAYIRGLK